MSYVREKEKIAPGCYYPGCGNEHGPRVKFCEAHGGSSPNPGKKGVPIGTVRGPQSKEHRAKISDSVRKSRQFERINWQDELAQFKKGKKKRQEFEMGSRASASSTQVRLRNNVISVGIHIWQEGHIVVLSKEARYG